jgi:FkbM family methyltransferase
MTRTIDLLAWIGVRIGKPPGWERVVRRFAPPEKCRGISEICVVREGMVFIAQPWVPLGWHVAMFGTYEPELRALIRAVLPPGGVAVDVGANVGWHTLLMANVVGPRGRVFAAEANPFVRRVLEQNISLNRFSNVEVVPCIISDQEGLRSFFGPPADDANSGDGHVVAADAGQPHVLQVESKRLDTIAVASRMERLDLLKVDVEGGEWPVLRGAEEIISKFRPNIVFEHDDEYASRGGGTRELFAEFLERHRYRGFAIGRNWATAIDAGHWPKSANILAIPAG